MKLRTAAAIAAAAFFVAAAPAAADSISYIKDGNIWLTTPDGSRQYQVTSTGGYSYASQADDGTLIGLHGRRLHRIARDGRVTADFATPASGDSTTFVGPFDPAISPDGTKVAYTYNWKYLYTEPGCTGLHCTYQRIEVGVAYSHADRLTAWDEPGLGRQSGWVHPSWIDNTQTLLSEKAVIFGNTDSIVDTVGNGNQAFEYWFLDDNAWYLQDGEISRTGSAAAFVGMKPHGMTADIIAVYRMTGRAPALPEACYHYVGPDGSYDSPSFSPDGRNIVFGMEYGHNPGVFVGPTPDLSAGCTLPDRGAALLIPGASEPDWGPADVPVAAPPPITPPPPVVIPPKRIAPSADGPGAAVGVRGVKRVKLAAALRKGIALTVEPGAPGKATAAAKAGKRTVAKGGATVGTSGKAKLTLRFTAAGKRALRGKKTAKLTVAVRFTPTDGAARTGTTSVVVKR
jgi:WD40-like Beta Propeller Repeat